MGYEVVYDPATGMWSIWSTVIDNWIKTGLRSPDEVGEWVAGTIREPKQFAIVDEEGFIVLGVEGSLEFYGSYDIAQAFLPRTAENLGIPPEKLKIVEVDPSVYVAYIKALWRAKAKEAKEGRKTGVEAIVVTIDKRTGRLTPVRRRVHKPPLESSEIVEERPSSIIEARPICEEEYKEWWENPETSKYEPLVAFERYEPASIVMRFLRGLDIDSCVVLVSPTYPTLHYVMVKREDMPRAKKALPEESLMKMLIKEVELRAEKEKELRRRLGYEKTEAKSSEEEEFPQIWVAEWLTEAGVWHPRAYYKTERGAKKEAERIREEYGFETRVRKLGTKEVEVRGFKSHSKESTSSQRVFEVKYWPKDKPEEAKVTYVKAESEEEAKKQIIEKGYEAEVTASYSEEEWAKLVGQHSSSPEVPTEEEFVRMGWIF